MIVVDSSAIVAIMLDEEDAPTLQAALGQKAGVVSAFSVFETETVLRRRVGPEAASKVRVLLQALRIDIRPFDGAQARLASEAYDRFGKGVHPARLNLADCAAYALAKSLGAPLLYEGEDFARTDVVSAVTA